MSHLRRVRDLMTRIRDARAIETALDFALQAMIEVTHADRVLAALVDEDQCTIRGRRGLGISERLIADLVVSLNSATSAGDRLLSSVVGAREPIATVADDPRLDPALASAFGPHRQLLTIPLVGRSVVVGTISAAWDSDGAADLERLDLAVILADCVSVAIETLRQVERERRERRIAEELHLVAQRITAGLSLDDVLATVLRAVEALLDASSASIYLADLGEQVGSNRFTTRHTMQPHWDEQTRPRPNGLTASVLRTRQPAIVEDAETDPRRGGMVRGDSRSFVVVPIAHDNRSVGVLYANWRERHKPSSHDLQLLRILAAYGGIAIDNARLHTRAVEAARFDGVLLAARTVAHEINNDLALTMGMAEIAQMQVHAGLGLDPSILDDIVDGAQRIARHVQQLQGVVRLEERHLHDLPPLLDLTQSGE